MSEFYLIGFKNEILQLKEDVISKKEAVFLTAANATSGLQVHVIYVIASRYTKLKLRI